MVFVFQTMQYILFTTLMIFNTCAFAMITRDYQYIDPVETLKAAREEKRKARALKLKAKWKNWIHIIMMLIKLLAIVRQNAEAAAKEAMEAEAVAAFKASLAVISDTTDEDNLLKDKGSVILATSSTTDAETGTGTETETETET